MCYVRAYGAVRRAGGRPGGEHTVVVVSFLDESVPYRFKVPAAPLTLRTFKDYLPRKGNYRYRVLRVTFKLLLIIMNKKCKNYPLLGLSEKKHCYGYKSAQCTSQFV